MDGLVTLLPESYSTRVVELWNHLETRFGLRGARITPYPHFSWQIAAHYDSSRVEEVLREIAITTPSFSVSTSGLGLFPGANPVLFIPVAKSPALIALHRRIWDSMRDIASEPSPFYQPDRFVPHITLAAGDLTPETAGAVLQELAFLSFSWDLPVDHLAWISQPTVVDSQVKFRIPFK